MQRLLIVLFKNRKETSMRVPPIYGFSSFGLLKNANNFSSASSDIPKRFLANEAKSDSICFSSNSKTQYIKKYNTLPEEIKEILSPKDAIDMFREMDRMARGREKNGKVGQGENSKVYENPWLDDYYVLILEDPDQQSEIVYSEKILGDSIWQDKQDRRVQLIKGIA